MYEISHINNDVKLGLQLKAERFKYVICASHFMSEVLNWEKENIAQPCFFPIQWFNVNIFVSSLER